MATLSTRDTCAEGGNDGTIGSCILHQIDLSTIRHCRSEVDSIARKPGRWWQCLVWPFPVVQYIFLEVGECKLGIVSIANCEIMKCIDSATQQYLLIHLLALPQLELVRRRGVRPRRKLEAIEISRFQQQDLLAFRELS